MSEPVKNSERHLLPVELRADLAGRLHNLGKLKHWLMAVAEACQNSIDSIRDSGREGGLEVEIQRAADLLGKTDKNGSIENIIVRDDGDGFNAVNFTSFCTPDSLLKSKRGGKGIGRIACLQVFDRIQVASTYQDGEKWSLRELELKRVFPFLVATEPSEGGPGFATEVRLLGLRQEHSGNASSGLEKVAEWLAEHFLPALIDKPKWLRSFTVRDGTQKRDITRFIDSKAQWNEQFSIRNYSFHVVCYALPQVSTTDQVRLIAGGRVVHSNTVKIEHYVPHLATVSDDRAHILLVHSPFFDEHVNDARNGVSFSDEADQTLLGITAAEFRERLGTVFRTRLADRLAQSTKKMRLRVEEIVNKKAKHYRPLLLAYFESKEFLTLSHSARSEDILSSLDSFKRRDADNLRKESRRLARLASDAEGYRDNAEKLVASIDAHKKTVLAEYVVLRKLLLDRLEQIISARDDGKGHLEAEIHDLIFPRKTDTESQPGTDHQLWILDDRLESHRYLASDKPMDGIRGDRPDLLIALDHPGAFASDPFSSSAGYERIVLVEFKRALEDLANVKLEELPHRQMMRYGEAIENGKAMQLGSKRPIRVTPNSRFYLYAICDLTLNPKLLHRLRREDGFISSPTGDGAFAVMVEGRYYVEYIGLDKLLEDAKARNQAFFKKLGMEI